MIRGMYIAATGMKAQRERMNVISNNLTNNKTFGYKRDVALEKSFKEELVYITGNVSDTKKVGEFNHGVYTDEIYISFKQGDLVKTGVKTDVAIDGQGFFVLETEDGPRYTRDGSFYVDNEGFLSYKGGHRVQGQNGPIQIGKYDFEVDRQGNVSIKDPITDASIYVNTIQIANFEDLSSMRKLGDNLFNNIDPNAQLIEFEGELFHEYIEQSNISQIQEISDMMAASSNYESNQRVLTIMNESLGKIINELGRV